MDKDEIIELGNKLQLIFESSQSEFYYIVGFIDGKKKED